MVMLVCVIVLSHASVKAAEIGPVQLVYAGRRGYPALGDDEFGVRLSQSRDLRERCTENGYRLLAPLDTSSAGSLSASLRPSWISSQA